MDRPRDHRYHRPEAAPLPTAPTSAPPSNPLAFCIREDIPIVRLGISAGRLGHMTIQKIEFLRGADLDAVVVKRLLTEERDDIAKRQRAIQDKHQMIRFQIGRGMSRATAVKTWGAEMVAEALDSEGLQTLAAAE